MKKIVKIFNSFEDEALAENQRRSSMTIAERLNEFAILQERVWGGRWTKTPITKKVSYEKITWKR